MDSVYLCGVWCTCVMCIWYSICVCVGVFVKCVCVCGMCLYDIKVSFICLM